MSNEEKKIIIDEDWKEQVQSEKESVESAGESAGESDGADPQPAAGALPPAGLQTMVSMLASQAMLSLGTLPNPISGKQEVRLDEARHFIDLIEVLQEKTNGNCTADESKLMEGLLHELRMGFLAVQNMPPSQEDAESTNP
ncbi:MAG: DUF1844 domain-containing protein [Planctomycetota bacterium]|nr:DUF1844 domain-containing protein [Planctomycetota bacterium]